MKHDHLIEFLIRKVEDILCDNLPPAAQVPDAIAVKTIRALISTPTVQTALERGNDTARAFALRAINCALPDETLAPRVTLAQVYSVMDELALMGLLQTGRGAHTSFWAKKPPAR
jgi:hypothetical protein